MFKPRIPPVATFILHILIACTLSTSVGVARTAEPDKKKAAWDEVQQVAKTAFKLRDEEMKLTADGRKAKFRQRADAFDDAARRLRAWIFEYYPIEVSRDNSDFVYAVFTLALYVEYSGNLWSAVSLYRQVQQRVHDIVFVRKLSEPTYRGAKIGPLADKKVRELNAVTANRRDPGDYVFEITNSVDEEAKRQARLDYLLENEAQLSRTIYKSETEEAEILRLRAESKADAVAAKSTRPWLTRYGLEILKSSSLPATVHSSRGLVIFGVGSNKVALRPFATRVQAINHLLGASSQEGSKTSPLAVFINVGGEEVAKKMALALSSRKYTGEMGECMVADSTAVSYRRNATSSVSEDRSLESLIARCIMQQQMYSPPSWLFGIPLLFEQLRGERPIDNERLYYLLEALDADKMPSIKRLLSPKEGDHAPERKLLTYAALRYFAFFLYLRQTEQNQLRDLYKILRNESHENSKPFEEVIESVTRVSPQSLQDEFIAFIRNRPVATVDKRWKASRRSAQEYVRKAPK